MLPPITIYERSIQADTQKQSLDANPKRILQIIDLFICVCISKLCIKILVRGH